MTFKIGDTVWHKPTEQVATVLGSSRTVAGEQFWVRVRLHDRGALVPSDDLVSVTSIRIEAGIAIAAAMRAASDLYRGNIPPAVGLMLANVVLDVLRSFDPAQRAALFEACHHCDATTEADCRGSEKRSTDSFYERRWGGC